MTIKELKRENADLRRRLEAIQANSANVLPIGIHDQLTPKERELLGILVQHRRVKRRTIEAQMYPDGVNSKLIDVFVCKIRKKLGIKINSVWGYGYEISEDCRQHIMGMQSKGEPV